MDRSETIGELAAALAKAQGAMGAALKGESNSFFNSRYADLAAIVGAIKEPLAANGLAYVQGTSVENGRVSIETMLLHASGEWLSSTLYLTPTKADVQGVGSAITYGRRYGLQALIGIPADDDDGNAASGHPDTLADSREVGKGNVTTPSAAESRYYTKQQPKAQSPQTSAPESFLLPDIPGQMITWFKLKVESMPELTWKPGVLTQNAKGLAIGLRTNGIGDTKRKTAYELLTGHDSGADMDPRQLVVLNHNASEAGAQKLLRLVAWSAAKAEQPTEPGVLLPGPITDADIPF